MRISAPCEVDGEFLCTLGGIKVRVPGGGVIQQQGQGSEYVVPSWYSEIRWYDFRAPVPEERTGHFTQVVWAATEEIGCVTCCLPHRWGRFGFGLGGGLESYKWEGLGPESGGVNVAGGGELGVRNWKDFFLALLFFWETGGPCLTPGADH